MVTFRNANNFFFLGPHHLMSLSPISHDWGRRSPSRTSSTSESPVTCFLLMMSLPWSFVVCCWYFARVYAKILHFPMPLFDVLHVADFALSLSFPLAVNARSRPLNFWLSFSSTCVVLSLSSKLGRDVPKLFRASRLPTIGEYWAVGETARDSAEECEFRCFRFFSNSSISERILRNCSCDVGVRLRRSGRVKGDPSMNREGRLGGEDMMNVDLLRIARSDYSLGTALSILTTGK